MSNLMSAIIQLRTFVANPPNWPGEEAIVEFHSILDRLEEHDLDMSDYRIPAEKVDFPIIGYQRGAFRGPAGRPIRGDVKRVDEGYFSRQIKGALAYAEANLERESDEEEINAAILENLPKSVN